MISLLRSFYASRAKSEQRTLLWGGSAVSLILLYFLALMPLLASKRSLATDVDRQALQLGQIEQLLRQRQSTGPSTPIAVIDPASLQALVDQVIRGQNLQNGLKGINTLEGNRVQVELQGINFDALARALEQLEQNQQLHVSELSLDAKGSGFVNVKLVLSR